MKQTFKALVVDKQEEQFSIELKDLTLDDLPQEEVTIKVMYSSVNYKDGLASIPDGNIVRSYPFIPGIDCSGVVIKSRNDRFKEGDEVIVTSYGLGVSHFGGFCEYVSVPANWVVALPKGLTFKEAMIYGTAGFTAALSIMKLEHHGLTPDQGAVVVSGASGGVGSVAVAMLAKKGYHVVASTGKTDQSEYLKQIGATEVISRDDISPEKFSSLGKGRFAAAVDPVGGNTLAYILSTLKYGGAVASSGLTGGTKVNTTVFPFILRGVSLLGIDSVECPMSIRQPLWEKMATELKPDALNDFIGHEITLEGLPEVLAQILKGQTKGRVIVKIG